MFNAHIFMSVTQMNKINNEDEIMNVVITLPKHLIDKIISGEKIYEMRKAIPKFMNIGEDGFFAVEKGTRNVRCWCRIDCIYGTWFDHSTASWFAARLCVDEEYVIKYAADKRIFLWKIGKVIELSGLDRNSLLVDNNPQQFAYCPLSYGQSY